MQLPACSRKFSLFWKNMCIHVWWSVCSRRFFPVLKGPFLSWKDQYTCVWWPAYSRKHFPVLEGSMHICFHYTLTSVPSLSSCLYDSRDRKGLGKNHKHLIHKCTKFSSCYAAFLLSSLSRSTERVLEMLPGACVNVGVL